MDKVTGSKIVRKIVELQETFLADLVSLVQIDSTEREGEPGKPFGAGVGACLDQALVIADRLGFSTCNMDGYIGYAQHGVGEEYVGVIGHLDVVPPGNGWEKDPFAPWRKDGKIYGRGVLDNKGPILSCLYALYACKECGMSFERPIRILFGTDEESGMEDLEYYLAREKPPVMGWTPDCKYPVVYGERGRANFRLAADSQRAAEFFAFVTDYFLQGDVTGAKLGIDYQDAEFGRMNIRGYKLHQESNGCAFDFVLSYPTGVTPAQLISRIGTKLPEGLELRLLRHHDPVKFPKDSFLVKELQAAYEQVTGKDGTPVTTTGSTYARRMPNIVPFGPSFPGQKGIGHQPNEWMSIQDMMTNMTIYAWSLVRLAGGRL